MLIHETVTEKVLMEYREYTCKGTEGFCDVHLISSRHLNFIEAEIETQGIAERAPILDDIFKFIFMMKDSPYSVVRTKFTELGISTSVWDYLVKLIYEYWEAEKTGSNSDPVPLHVACNIPCTSDPTSNHCPTHCRCESDGGSENRLE